MTEKGEVETGKKEFMRRGLRIGLTVYFSALIVLSLIILIFVWNPIQGSLNAINSEEKIITEKNGNKTIITTIKNSSTASAKHNETSVMIIGDRTIRNESVTIEPLTGQAFNTDPELVFTNTEIRLVMFAIFFGVIGASVHGLSSLTAWISTRKLESKWETWYFTRPPIGATLAVITYLILRAGFVSGSPTAISDFGVAAISALVGLMTDEMTRKLRDIFDSLFGIAKPEVEKGEISGRRP